MRIAGQILEDMFGSSEWPFGINHPVLAKQRPKKSMEGFLFGEWFRLPGNSSFRSGKPLQAGDELAAKHTAENFHRQKEG